MIKIKSTFWCFFIIYYFQIINKFTDNNKVRKKINVSNIIDRVYKQKSTRRCLLIQEDNLWCISSGGL